MNINQTAEDLSTLISVYESLIKTQNDIIQEKNEAILILKKFIEIQEVEKDLIYKKAIQPSLN